MFIDESILRNYGAIIKKYDKNEIIFHEGELATNFYQIKNGSVRMYNTNSDSKEFTQGIFNDGNSFGEPPLFLDECYPATAVAVNNCNIFRMPKDNFFRLLHENETIQFSFITLFAKRILFKANTLRDITNSTPTEKLSSFLSAYKNKNSDSNEPLKIPFTRQEIANFTGLRVETVIRTLKKMEENKLVSIINRNLFY